MKQFPMVRETLFLNRLIVSKASVNSMDLMELLPTGRWPGETRFQALRTMADFILGLR